MAELGHDASVVGVAKIYRDLASLLVIDDADVDRAPEVEAVGMRCVVTDTIMRDVDIAAALNRTIVDAVLTAS